MRLRWDARALQDLRDIRRYIGAHGSPAAADRVRQHLRTRVDRLLTNPSIGVVTETFTPKSFRRSPECSGR